LRFYLRINLNCLACLIFLYTQNFTLYGFHNFEGKQAKNGLPSKVQCTKILLYLNFFPNPESVSGFLAYFEFNFLLGNDWVFVQILIALNIYHGELSKSNGKGNG